MGSVAMIVGTLVTSGILRASASQMIPSALRIAPRVVGRQKNLRISSTRSCTTRGAQSTPRATTRFSSAQLYASPSSLRCQMCPRRSPIRRTKMMTRKTLTGSRNLKMWSMSYLVEIQASPSVPRSCFSGKSSQLSLQFRDP